MTENKRYLIVDSNFVPEGKYIKDNKTKHTFPTTTRIATLIMYEQVLNEQEKEIQRLKCINRQLEERIKELESENKMLKLTIGRNESYIKRLTTKGKWSNTGDVE